MTVTRAASLGVGAMVGAGIFALLGEVGAVVGSSVWLAFVGGGVVALLNGYSYGHLGARYPSVGGPIDYLARGYGVGVFSGGLSLFDYAASVIGMALVARACGSYVAALLGAGQPSSLLVGSLAAAAVVGITLVNAAGSGSVGLYGSTTVSYVLAKMGELPETFDRRVWHHAPDTTLPICNMNVAFAWRGGPLLTLHNQEVVATKLFRDRAIHQPDLAASGTAVFLGILKSKVYHLADVLESTYGSLEQLSRRVLSQTEPDLHADLVGLAALEDQNGKIRLNLMDTQRVLTSLHRNDRFEEGIRRLGEVLSDVESLLSHTAFLLEEIGFLSDTIIGLINIEQNQIVKVLSVIAAVFLPPTLIASLYGMNFHHMPKLSWPLGYPIAILMMVLFGAAPYLQAKRRSWM